MSNHILIVDNDPLQSRTADLIVSNKLGYKTTIINSGQEAIDHLLSARGRHIELLLLDLSMPEVDGIDVIEAVLPKRPDLPIIIYTAHGDVKKAVEALSKGAVDFVEKQDSPDRLKVSIENALKQVKLVGEVSRLQRSITGQVSFDDIIGDSKPIQETKQLGSLAAQSNIPVIIKGESGVGKELFARAIHGSSSRSSKPFIAVNCGAIPENLVESVLFGHEKGAFTGAVEKTMGKFREADGGTLFLDEIGELKPDLQVKLLRALQEGEIEPVGGGKPIKVDIRLISATNRNLKKAVQDEEFREDLYYRVNVFPITVPPLRERNKDIEMLLEYFCERISCTEKKQILGVKESLKKALRQYDWPGNVRQLENTIYRAVVLCDRDYLDVGDFSQVIDSIEDAVPAAPGVTAPADPHSVSLVGDKGEVKALADIEAEIIESALEYHDWKISKTARALNIGRSTLYRKMEEYNIQDRQTAA